MSYTTKVEISYNTLTSPAGGQFPVMLPDGSRVWLNNASFLRYPVDFTGKTREVELKGEAYFEIARNTAQPLRSKLGRCWLMFWGPALILRLMGMRAL